MAHNLQCNTSAVSALIHSSALSDSLFEHNGWTTVKNFFMERKDVEPERAAAWGDTTTFKIPIFADKVGDIQLMFKAGFLTPNGGVGVPPLPAYQDFIGFTAWEKVEWRYGTNILYTITPEELFDEIITLYPTEGRDARLECVLGKKSFADRQNDATVDQEVIVDLNFPWARGLSRFLGQMQLAQEPRISIKWRKPEDFVQNGGVPLVVLPTLTDVQLRMTVFHVDADERDKETYHTESQDGKVQFMMEHKYEKVRITGPVAGEHKIKLNNFRSDASVISFIVRKTDDVDTVWDKNEFGDLQRINTFSLSSMNETFVHKQSDKYNRFHLHPKFHAGPAGEFRYFHSFAADPDEKMNATGALDLGCKTNLTLTIDFSDFITVGAGYNGDIEVVAEVWEHNTEQRVRGDHVKNFH